MKNYLIGMISLPTNNFISNITSALNEIISASQALLPYVSAVFLVGAFFMYMYSDKFADTAKTKIFKVFIAIGGISGVMSVVAWLQQIAKF